MLLGNYITHLTEGNRVAIPKKFRTQLGEELILAKWYENCLVVIGLTAWQELLQKLTGKQEILTAAVRDTDRFILGSAFELVPDRQGRIIIPENLTTFAQLSAEVVFLGLGDRVEIWDKKTWENKEREIAQTAPELIEKLAHD